MNFKQLLPVRRVSKPSNYKLMTGWKPVLLFLFLQTPIFGQILQDNTTKEWISEGLDKMYNYEFKEAAEQFAKVKEKYPKHPAYPMLMAIATEMQYFPLKDHPAQAKQYLNYLTTALAAAQTIIDKNEDDVEGTFFMMITQGYQAAYSADNSGVLDALGPAKRSYNHLKKGMKMVNQEPEFLFACGLYNYYRIAYPETHTVLKPFMWVFMSGDKKTGLQQMDLATRKALFTRIEALFYIGYVQMKYEANATKTLAYNNLLMEKYPNNLMFLMQRAEALATLGKYEEAEPIARNLAKLKNPMYGIAGFTFAGIAQEKGQKDDVEAENLYQKAIKLPFEERFSKDYQALAYLGLGRIATRAKQPDKAKEYYKKAKNQAEYATTIAEAKRALKE